VDKTTAAIVLSETDINTWNEKVNTSFNLLGSAINTDVDTVNSLGDESNTQALQAGQVAAALSGMRDTVATNTFEKVIEKMAGVIANNGTVKTSNSIRCHFNKIPSLLVHNNRFIICLLSSNNRLFLCICNSISSISHRIFGNI
jgi:hypothetical protein